MKRNHEQSAALFARALKVTPGGVHSPVRAFRQVGGTPVFIDRADGAYLFDVDGNRYLDFCLSWGPLIFGHNDPDIAEAAKTAIDRGTSFGAAEAGSLELAELITRAIPWVEQLRFVNSGTEAVMAAIRVARAATGRDKILKFAGCYHGHMDGLLVQAGSGLAGQAIADSAGVPAGTAADTLVAPLDDLAAVESIFAAHGSQIAAVIIEPIPANNGLLPQSKEYLDALAALTRRHGALLIFDEVITGFRLAFGGAAEYFGVIPDLVTYGKIIGGGFPVGAYGGRTELMQQVAPSGNVYQAGTLSGNPVAMAAGLATLKKLQRLSPYAELEARTQALARVMEEQAAAHPSMRVRCQSVGSLFWIYLDHDTGQAHSIVRSPEQIPAAHAELYPPLFHALLDASIYLPPSPWEVGFLSTAHDTGSIEIFVQAFTVALSALNLN
jgi:glutamate-1-semialdehyde 2,1-aminomutase